MKVMKQKKPNEHVCRVSLLSCPDVVVEETYPKVEDSEIVLDVLECWKVEEVAPGFSGKSSREQEVRRDSAKQTDESHDSTCPAETYSAG